MIIRLVIGIGLILSFTGKLTAQTFLKGKVYQALTDSTLYGVNVFNHSSKLSVRSGPDGSYSIAATEGDHVIFSMSGLKSDTVTVTYGLLLTQYDVTLSIMVVSLKEVTVTGSYRIDSLARRNYYENVYAKKPGITGYNRPENGVGVSLSPLSFFSGESKQQRELKKRLIKDEREDFIDHSFPEPWVASLTGLRGDSLSLFMYLYRPSYSFCRRTDKEGMMFYVNDRLKEFKKPKEKK